MKVTLTHDGKSVELDLTAEQMAALGLKEEKKTGYERVEFDHTYHYVAVNGQVINTCDTRDHYDCDLYEEANYYTDAKLAEDNARADRLMRELRRFAAENGGIPSVEDWNNSKLPKYLIFYNHAINKFLIDQNFEWHACGLVYFLSPDACNKATDKFRDELIWYFTEYEAMLR